MTSAQKDTLKEMNNPVVLDAFFVSDGVRISDFKGGEAELVAEYPTTHPVRVWYITESGEKELIPSTYDGKVATFIVTHFSHYVIEMLDGSSYGFDSCVTIANLAIASLKNGHTSREIENAIRKIRTTTNKEAKNPDDKIIAQQAKQAVLDLRLMAIVSEYR